MRRRIPILILAALVAVASRPLWSAQFLASYDGPLHLLRVFALDLTLRQGVVYPRWLLDLAYGYGYPIFNFYPPFAPYIAETVHLLGLGFAEAVKTTFIAIIAVALLGAYALGTELFAAEKNVDAIGILTAIGYVFFPYFMVGIYTRGALAEAFAVALLPWSIWSLRRALVRRTVSSLLLLGLFLAILFLSHSLTALLLTPLLVTYILLELSRLPAARRTRALAVAAASAAMCVGLTAFYWLPFVAELPLVRMGRGMDILADVFETNFLKPSSLVQSTWLYDYGGPPVPLGLAATTIGALALLGTVLAGRKIKERGTILFFGLVALIGAIAIAEPARELWLAFPLSNMIQSVWRVELLINLASAVVIGSLPLVLSAHIPFERLRLPVANLRFDLAPLTIGALVAIVLIWTTVANLAPAEIHLPRDLFDLAHLARFEVSGASPGTTTFGEYMPVTVTAPDLVTFAQEIEKQNGSIPDIGLVRHDGAQWVLAVSAPEPVSIPLRAFYFPDWRATVDGKPVVAYSSTAMGLLTVAVPGGNHEVRLSIGDTPARQIGLLVSGATALIVVGLAAYGIRRRESDVWMPLLVIGMLLLVILLPATVAMTAPPASLETKRVSVSPGFDLIGLSVDSARLESGTWHIGGPLDRLHVRAYWQVKGSGLPDNPITWRLADDSNRVWAQRAQFPRYGTALQHTWVSNEVVQDEYNLPFSAAIPPGRYRLQLSSNPQQDFVTSGLIELEGESRPTLVGKPQPTHPMNALVGNRIRFLGYDAPATAEPGERYALTLYWQAEQDVLEDYTASVQLLDPGGKLVAQHDSVTGEGLNPTSLWIPGEAVVERRQIDLPHDLKLGAYTLIALMYRLRDQKRLPVVTDAGPSPDDAIVLSRVQVSSNSQVHFPSISPLFAALR
jgi:hypothetical protein